MGREPTPCGNRRLAFSLPFNRSRSNELNAQVNFACVHQGDRPKARPANHARDLAPLHGQACCIELTDSQAISGNASRGAAPPIGLCRNHCASAAAMPARRRQGGAGRRGRPEPKGSCSPVTGMPPCLSASPMAAPGTATKKTPAIATRKPIIEPGNDVADSATAIAGRMSKMMNVRWVTAGNSVRQQTDSSKGLEIRSRQPVEAGTLGRFNRSFHQPSWQSLLRSIS